MTTDAQQATEAEEWLDNLDPATTPAKDARHLRKIAGLRQTIADSEQELRSAVQAARASGDSWSAIGIALGTSRQAAFQRFSGVDGNPLLAPSTTETLAARLQASYAREAAEFEQATQALFKALDAEDSAGVDPRLRRQIEGIAKAWRERSDPE